MRAYALLACLALTCSILCAQPANPGAAPVVLQTSPAALSNDVDPTLDKITVTFDRPMTDGSWSWTGGGDTYPQLTGKPSYDDEKTTCTVPVKLEPGKAYWVGINSPSHQNFKSADGQPARRYVIAFATKSADGKATPLPPEMLTRARQINGPAKATVQASPEQKAATESAEDWMQLVDAGAYEEMWQTLDPLAQKLTDQKTFTGQVSAVRDAMGPLVKRTFSSAERKTELPGVPDGNYYLLEFKSSFEKKKQAIETAVMSEQDGAWKVSGYFVK